MIDELATEHKRLHDCVVPLDFALTEDLLSSGGWLTFEDLPRLLEYLGDAKPFWRLEEGISGVAELGQPAECATGPLIDIIFRFEGSEPSTAVMAIQALPKIQEPAYAVYLLCQIVTHCKVISVRKAALDEVTKLPINPSYAVPVLVEMLSQEDSPYFLWSAAQAVVKYGAAARDAVPALVDSLSRPLSAEGFDVNFGEYEGARDATHEAICEALGSIGADAKDAQPALMTFVTDFTRTRDWEIVVSATAALHALTKINCPTPAMVREITKALHTPLNGDLPLEELINRRDDFREAAEIALHRFGSAVAIAIPDLVQYVEDTASNALDSWVAIYQLRRLGPKAEASIPVMLRAARSQPRLLAPVLEAVENIDGTTSSDLRRLRRNLAKAMYSTSPDANRIAELLLGDSFFTTNISTRVVSRVRRKGFSLEDPETQKAELIDVLYDELRKDPCLRTSPEDYLRIDSHIINRLTWRLTTKYARSQAKSARMVALTDECDVRTSRSPDFDFVRTDFFQHVLSAVASRFGKVHAEVLERIGRGDARQEIANSLGLSLNAFDAILHKTLKPFLRQRFGQSL